MSYRRNVPLLHLLGDYGEGGNKIGIRGYEIGPMLKYESLIDLLPHTSDYAIREPEGDRSPLRHADLRRFLMQSFDLESFGLPPHSRVGILLPNGPELAVCIVSVISRWCAVPINPQSTSTEIESELKGTQAQAIIILSGEGSGFSSAALQAADKLKIGVLMLTPSAVTCGLFTLSLLRPVNYRPLSLPPPSSLRQELQVASYYGHGETVLVLHTSGTSGNKKRVPYTLDSLVVGVACIVAAWNLTPADVNLNMMPLFHIGGIIRNVFSPILSGGSVIACSGFDPVLFWEVLQSPVDFKVTWYYAAPTMHHAILQQAERIRAGGTLKGVDTVRFIANAAGALLPALAKSLQSTFNATILTGYGMTECMPISSPPQSYQLSPTGTSGIVCGPDVVIADPDHTATLPPLVTGHVMVRGSPCFHGYEAETEKANDEVFFTLNGENGWFDTGDIGHLDEAGYLFISGRSKEIINRGGETISPFEIEEVLVQHPCIKEACAFSAPHVSFQETVGVVIVTETSEPRIDLPTLHDYLVKKLHRSKWPQVIVYMNALPKNNTNKILRIRLDKRFNLPVVNEDSPPVSRLYEATCPPPGASLSSAIPITPVVSDARVTEDFILSNTDVLECRVLHIDLSGRVDTLVAFVTPSNSCTEESILTICRKTLHAYACPFLVVQVDCGGSSLNELPENDLYILAVQRFNLATMVLPRNPVEVQLETIWRELLGSPSVLSVTSSFFDLGGDSLQAGQLVNAIRKKMKVQISVSDLFLAPTIEQLSHKVSALKTLGSPSMSAKIGRRRSGSHRSVDDDDNVYLSWEYSNKNFSNTSWLALLVQVTPMLFIYPFRRIIMWFTIAIPWVYFMQHNMGRFKALVIAIIVSRIFSGIFNPLVSIAAKWLIIGRYKPGRYSLWGDMYLRWWLVEQIHLIFGKGFVDDDIPIIGNYLVRMYYSLMGASIGRNVCIHKDAKLGQADLLTIGDDVVIDAATVRPFALEESHMILLPIRICNRSSIGLKSAIAPGTTIESDTCIGPLSSSYESGGTETDDRKYCRPAFTSPPIYLVLFVGIPILVLTTILSLVPWFFTLKLMVSSAMSGGWYVSNIHNVYHAFLWWIEPRRLIYYFLIRIVKRCVVPFCKLGLVILLKWSLIGKFVPLSGAEKQSDWNLFRYWLMSKLLPGSHLGGVATLVGTHYEIISCIYRALGAKVGERVYWPGSGLEIVEYDLLEVGNDVVFGSRSVILTSSSDKSASVVFEDGSMVADRCVILPGLHLKKGAVLGSGSLSPENFLCPTGSIWVGSRDGTCINVSPEDKTFDRKDCVSPFGKAFYQGNAPYFVLPLWAIVVVNMTWQAFCTCYRNAPTVLALILVVNLKELTHENYHHPIELFRLLYIAFIPVFVSMSIVGIIFVICTKWHLLGKREPGAYPWDESSYCQRWQLYLTLEEIRRGEDGKVGVLDLFRGSQYLVWYFKALGADIGVNVCLYPNGGDPMMTEPDLVSIGDATSVDDSSLIAHINTRGVFRLNPLVVGNGCVLKSNARLLSGAEMADHSIMLEHTLVLAGDCIDTGSVWQGWPSCTHNSLDVYRKNVMRMVDQETVRSQMRHPARKYKRVEDKEQHQIVIDDKDVSHNFSLGKRVSFSGYSEGRVVGSKECFPSSSAGATERTPLLR
mmetsp:Transcript_1799/g.2830  ORF Transcript_1799/g.2830 Transcript_1799/m.2830 type:complete len:1652 (-) Transcript_1799:132-5087(-)